MNTIRVRIPCRRFTVRVTMSRADGMTTFEEYALRMLAAGVTTVESLAAALALDRNVVLDTCVDLLRAGYIAVTVDGTIQVAQAVLDEMGDPRVARPAWASKFSAATTPAPAEYDLLQDLVSGAVFPSAAGMNAGGESLLAPEDTRLGEITSVQKPVLLEATAGLMRRLGGGRRSSSLSVAARKGLRVSDVVIVGAAVSGAPPLTGPASIVVDVAGRPAIDDSARPSLTIVGPSTLSGSIRRRIALRLMSMWEEGIARERAQFFPRLQQRILSAALKTEPREAGRFLDPRRAVDDLNAALPRMRQADAGNEQEVLDVHAELSVLERTATADLDEARTLQATVEPVVGAAEHRAWLLRALREATHQVVLMSPWVGQLGRSEEIRDAFIDAVDRGIRIHLIWGVDRAASFDAEFGPVGTDLAALLAPREQRIGGLFLSRRSAGSHAKLIACDLSWALVSSCNVLNTSPGRSELELGALVSAPNGGPLLESPGGDSSANWSPADCRRLAASAVCSIVHWAAKMVPDFELRRAVVDDPALDGTRILTEAIELDGAIEPPGDVALWRSMFEQRAGALAKRAQSLGTVVLPVLDGEHREYLIDALRCAQRRVVIASKDLGVGILGRSVSELVLAARERGVEVTIFHTEFADWSDELEQRAIRLRDAGAVIDRRLVHAKVLVCDDWTIVSSYNFLSFAGYYDQHSRARHELGVRVLSSDVADRVVAILADAPAHH